MSYSIEDSTDDIAALANGTGPSDPLSQVLNAAQNKIIPAGGLNKKLNTSDMIDIQRSVNKYQLFVSTLTNLMKAFFDTLKGVARNLSA
ncbi:EscF/YscF/HrpA family type III secretion system needle major subunit [Bordetella sp. LUAb4]|uniref:EscF/YscF/HrpA family type III secretion system needle major subunit n=1 Tax=Bordetella sp. LUAb4 TaxID=2843195 RepID=UPI001E2F7389|nr:EscF/YscF/HrpA family type III secretion system needle major subunit [Bordetella sp. LUAb4]